MFKIYPIFKGFYSIFLPLVLSGCLNTWEDKLTVAGIATAGVVAGYAAGSSKKPRTRTITTTTTEETIPAKVIPPTKVKTTTVKED